MKLDLFKSLKVLNITDFPAIIHVGGEMTITIDAEKRVSIHGASGFMLSTDSDIDFRAKNIDMRATDSVYIGSDKDVTVQSKLIDLNPKQDEGGFSKK